MRGNVVKILNKFINHFFHQPFQPDEKTGARGKGGACDVWTEQVRKPHLNNTHTHFKNLNTLSPTIRARCFEFGVLKVLRNTQMFYLAELTLLTCLRIFVYKIASDSPKAWVWVC